VLVGNSSALWLFVYLNFKIKICTVEDIKGYLPDTLEEYLNRLHRASSTNLKSATMKQKEPMPLTPTNIMIKCLRLFTQLTTADSDACVSVAVWPEGPASVGGGMWGAEFAGWAS